MLIIHNKRGEEELPPLPRSGDDFDGWALNDLQKREKIQLEKIISIYPTIEINTCIRNYDGFTYIRPQRERNTTSIWAFASYFPYILPDKLANQPAAQLILSHSQ